MINSLKTSFFACIILTFAACDSGTTFTKSLVNQTDETITLKFTIGTTETEVSIEPNETGSIWIDEQSGISVAEDYSCTDEFDAIAATVSNNKILTLNLLDDNNWVNLSDLGGRNEEVDCTITVTQSDIQ